MHMELRRKWGAAAAGLAAGMVNGIFGGAGGMILIPALRLLAGVEENRLFPLCVCVMLPVSILSLYLGSRQMPLPWDAALPYLLGSGAGGILAGLLGSRIPTVWLHRILGGMILWGGICYLW